VVRFFGVRGDFCKLLVQLSLFMGSGAQVPRTAFQIVLVSFLGFTSESRRNGATSCFMVRLREIALCQASRSPVVRLFGVKGRLLQITGTTQSVHGEWCMNVFLPLDCRTASMHHGSCTY
jgi:hypothetical protein